VPAPTSGIKIFAGLNPGKELNSTVRNRELIILVVGKRNPSIFSG
jgi:hypothetical protein